MTDLARRRNIANASSGYPEQTLVVAYALIHDDGKPHVVLSRLRDHAEAEGWGVYAEFFDFGDMTSSRASRHSWPKAERLLQDRDVTGLVARCEDEIAFYPKGKESLQKWLHSLPAFAKFIGEPPSGVVR
ncbi:hypothetical protein [Streptomyces luteireticuli]|uniref:hypothetical protein n=1 Tax=Streptomyces luteireticuli TaxID=173858 RepID=UPI0035564B11